MSTIPHPIIFVRHGETPWNAIGRYQGTTDTNLSPDGALQASENADLIQKFLADKVPEITHLNLVCSPLARARETAAIIAKTDDRFSPIALESDFRELSQGRWEGLTSQQVKDAFYDERKSRKSDRWNFHPSGGESMSGRRSMIEQALRNLRPSTVVVTHSVVLRIIWHILGNLKQEIASQKQIPHVGLLIWDGTKLSTMGSNAA